MKIKIDYLNKDKEPKNIILDGKIDEVDLIGFEILTILKQGATDITIYKL